MDHFKRARAKQFRVNQTTAERILWRRLKHLQLDQTHFRRQVPIGPYIVDFACLKHRLVIEVDGPSHSYEVQQRRDDLRTAFLQGCGYRVLRFWNDAVKNETDTVIDTILAALGSPSP